jgi:hypothetical protein
LQALRGFLERLCEGTANTRMDYAWRYLIFDGLVPAACIEAHRGRPPGGLVEK